jgi:hypothetical protein
LDSNQRRLSQRIYSPSPLATRAPLRYLGFFQLAQTLTHQSPAGAQAPFGLGTNAKSASERIGCGRWLFVFWAGVSIEDCRGKPAFWPRKHRIPNKLPQRARNAIPEFHKLCPEGWLPGRPLLGRGSLRYANEIGRTHPLRERLPDVFGSKRDVALGRDCRFVQR